MVSAAAPGPHRLRVLAGQVVAAGRIEVALRAVTARRLVDGHLRRDPMARLALPSGRTDPYAQYERLRDAGPLVPTRQGTWVTTSHALAGEVLRDRRFGVRPVDDPDAASLLDLSFLDRDEPDHARLRRVAAPWFSPRRGEQWQRLAQESTDRLVEDLLARGRTGPVDLVAALGVPLPVAVITAILGVPDADAARLGRLGTTLGTALDGVGSVLQARRVMAARDEVREMFTDLLARRRTEPGEDVLSRLAGDDGLSVDERLSLATLLLLAGFETTVNLLGNAVHALLTHPEQQARWRADPDSSSLVVEETLRWDAPVQRTARIAHEPLTLAGVDLPAGAWVELLIGAANRDPAAYPRPEAFDPWRPDPVPHLAFSAGAHFCLGAPLARLEAATALRALATRVDLEPAGGVRRHPGTTLRGLTRLPVRVSAR